MAIAMQTTRKKIAVNKEQIVHSDGDGGGGVLCVRQAITDLIHILQSFALRVCHRPATIQKEKRAK